MKIKSYFVQLPYSSEQYEVGKRPQGHAVKVDEDVTVINISYQYNPISHIADGVVIDLSNGERIEFNDSVPCRTILIKDDENENQI